MLEVTQRNPNRFQTKPLNLALRDFEKEGRETLMVVRKSRQTTYL